MKDKNYADQKISYEMCKNGIRDCMEFIMEKLHEVKTLCEEYQIEPNENKETDTTHNEDILDAIFITEHKISEGECKKNYLRSIKKLEMAYKKYANKYFDEITE